MSDQDMPNIEPKPELASEIAPEIEIDTTLKTDTEIADMQSDQWSRVSPLAIIYFFAKTVYVLVSGFLIYSLPAIAASYSKIKEHPIYLVFAIGAILGLILLGSIAKYWFYFYRFKGDRVEIKQGVISKHHLDLPFKKIQNVKIVQPLYYRFNNYSYIELDTAGSAQQEAKIVALPLHLAESFKQLILQIKENLPASDTSGEQQAGARQGNQQGKQQGSQIGQEVLLNTRSMKDLIIHGISNNRVWIFLGVLAPFFNSIGENLGKLLEVVGINLAAYLDYESLSMGIFILHVLSLALLIMLAIVSFSVIGSIFVFYKYRLSRLGDRYIRRSGLLTKHEVSMRLSRIQIAVQQQDWLDMLIKRTNLRFEQNTSLFSSNGQPGNINNASKLIVPSVTPNESIELIQDTFDVKRFTDIVFTRISKRFVIRVMAFPIIPIIGIFVVIGFASSMSVIGWGILSGISLLLFAMVWLRWWRWGYFFDERFVYIRKGFFGVNYYVFPIEKTQQVSFSQSLFMRRGKIADLRYVLASGAHKVPLIPEQLAKAQVDEALLVVARDKPAWM